MHVHVHDLALPAGPQDGANVDWMMDGAPTELQSLVGHRKCSLFSKKLPVRYFRLQVCRLKRRLRL
jgi:hypothetical protein